MIHREDVDDRIAHARTERIVRVPDEFERPGGLRASIAPWMVFFAVGVIAAVALFAVVVSRGPDGDVASRPGGGGASIGTEPDLSGYRTHTVNVDGSVDVLALALSPGSLVQYHGAPITADGVVVDEVFGPEAFTVTSPTGTELVVYVPPRGEPAAVTMSPGQEITFLGTLMPVRPDFGFLVGPAAAPLAQPDGVYLYAVPETISVLTTQPS